MKCMKNEAIWMLWDPIDELDEPAVENDQTMIKSKWRTSIESAWQMYYDKITITRNTIVGANEKKNESIYASLDVVAKF